MGRPPKPENLRRSKMLPLRLTEEEWNFLLTASRETSMSVSDILRSGARLFIEKKGKDGSRKRKDKKR